MQAKKATMLAALLAIAAAGARAQVMHPAVEPGGTRHDIVGSRQANVRAEVTFSPLVDIQLGSDKDLDVVALKQVSLAGYRDGVAEKREKQLKIFSVGTGYTVKATLTASTSSIDLEALYKIFWLRLDRAGSYPGTTPPPTEKVAASTMENLYKTGPENTGTTELDATYGLRKLTNDNLDEFHNLLGYYSGPKGPKTYTIDIVYTVTAN